MNEERYTTEYCQAETIRLQDQEIDKLRKELALIVIERDLARNKANQLLLEACEAHQLTHDIAGVLASGCEDNDARAPVEWAEHVIKERDALRDVVRQMNTKESASWCIGGG